MKEMVVVAWDDLDLKEDRHVPTGTTVRLTVVWDAGDDSITRRTIELDLSDDHAGELADDLAPWLEAGRDVEEAEGGQPQADGERPARRNRKFRSPADRLMDRLGLPDNPRRGFASPERTEYLKRVRTWAEEQGRGKEIITESGGYYYSAPLLRDWQAYLAEVGRRQEAS